MIRLIAAVFASCWVLSASAASCVIDGKSSQTVGLSVEGKQLERWEITGPEIRRVRLPKGFELGVKIEPATPEKYRELFSRRAMRGMDELVKIELYDMSESTPKVISTTWGGANSKQGFGPRGGANGVATGDQVELWFHKPACITPESLPAAR